MTRRPLGQLTNLLACINNELTHKTTKKGKQRTDWQKCDRNKNKKSIDLCQLEQEEEDGGTVGEEQEVRPLISRPSGCPALWTPIECVALSHTDTHSHERVDLINQCNLSTVHLKSVVCFRGTRHFYLNTNSPHTRPAAIPKLTRILSVRRGGLVQLLINTVKTSARPHTLPKYSYCIPCKSISEL